MTALIDALQATLAAEHACIWGYGVVGARLSDANESRADTVEAVHRHRRDTLVARLTSAGAVPVATQPSYGLPFAVHTPAESLRLAVLLEVRTGAVWRALLAATDQSGIRQLALGALTDTAVRAARWRTIGGIRPVTVAFPGRT